VKNDETRGRLFSALLALMTDQEMIAMIERMIARDNLILDTPYMRRLRTEGRIEGRTEGLTEGRKEGSIDARHRDLLDVLVLRFEPSISLYRKIEERLLTFNTEAQLKSLLAMAVKSKDIKAFQSAMDKIK
jgi:hypothetical protein